MRSIIFIFVAVISKCLAGSVTLLKKGELAKEMMNNPRYILRETKEGYSKAEDFPIENDVTFYIHTPENIQEGVKINMSQKTVVNITGISTFKTDRPTLVSIHGWEGSHDSEFNAQVKNATLENHDVNVIVVDWEPLASQDYFIARDSVSAVGKYIGDFLLRLHAELDYGLKNFTVVGHSLGAHIAGNAGARTKGLIDTIVGLDPAGPFFSISRTEDRLDPGDAEYVQVVHTSDFRFGFAIKMGHVDYYANGGRQQPGCGLDLAGGCSHGRSFVYFAESLKNNRFVSMFCDGEFDFIMGKCDGNVKTRMGGYPVERGPHGKYFFKTSKAPPFAKG